MHLADLGPMVRCVGYLVILILVRFCVVRRSRLGDPPSVHSS